MNEREAMIALALVPSIDLPRFQNLIAMAGSAEDALSAPLDLLRAVPGMSPAAASGVRAAKSRDVGAVLQEVQRMGATVMLHGDEGFPERLQEIPDPPVILFAQGLLELLTRPAVAVVGSRDNTAYGAEVAQRVASAASAAGITVVSGMARGIDAVAHHSALGGAGSSIGVLANGLDVFYPLANRELYERMAGEGLLLTEFPPGDRPFKGSFPRRNRLVSGLASVTVVIEAGERSGALITAKTALEQGKDVMAVPGRITDESYVGVNELLRDGAEPMLSVEDLFVHYPDIEMAEEPEPMEQPALPPTLSCTERTIAELLLAGERPLDEVAQLAALSIPEALVALSTLELEGVVTRSAGSVFALADRPLAPLYPRG